MRNYFTLFRKRTKIEEEKVTRVEETDNEETSNIDIIAAIASAVVCFSGSEEKSFYIKTIRRIADTVPIWNKIGRLEQITRMPEKGRKRI
ncbi:hypothetical protein M2349_001130 [Caldanaerobacter subterraneus subsp. tengcongensis MB4]|uniref:Uncharacterized protein n=1 Tax=Caldanaerobacter subterraneus subsp. tengcongensis (strain DSM 15242 / JCM 11007 / NBRC 100824 / MB4) TaxID=273068 RepID=Q8RAJ3_CALS4|nr:hypothetical protein [Caldanaerobacter subterraneus]AAM24451.1 hypothetical protein TTE1221 [Caldanaerobacter subterraneus subsp. tengcongensis MB4]MBE3579640.1 sodium pump decarboxylase subunit gamma [Caldanaerobacter subterraneus]MCS3915989.1 hypothetical protein [Caldanaerobacter subterraneus subsp. tengcongensis MB4]